MMHLPPPPKSDDLQDVYAIAQDIEVQMQKARQRLGRKKRIFEAGTQDITRSQISHVVLLLLLDQCEHWRQCHPTHLQSKLIQQIEDTTRALKDINHQIRALTSEMPALTTKEVVPTEQAWRLSHKAHGTTSAHNVGNTLWKGTAHFIDAMDPQDGDMASSHREINLGPVLNNRTRSTVTNGKSESERGCPSDTEDQIPCRIPQWLREAERGKADENFPYIDKHGVVYSRIEGRC